MPTTSIAGTLTLTNLGAVTTTFTAPGSCATQWKNFRYGYGPEDFPDFVPAGSCDELLMKSECFPHGDKLFEIKSSVFTAFGYELAQPYYSPAWDCPAGWTTAGVAGMSAGIASVNGVFSPSGAAETVTRSFEVDVGGTEGTITAVETKTPVNFVPNMITSALGPDETAILCCPSGYTADAYHAGCLTHFPGSSLSGIEGCYPFRTSEPFVSETSTLIDTWEFDGQTFTETHRLPPRPTDFFDGVTKVSYFFGADGHPMTVLSNGSSVPWLEPSDFEGAAFQPFLVLIANGSGTEAGGNITEAGDDDSAASVSTHSLWAMGAALFAGFVAVAAL